jgi:cell wall-associated NlpC family hydrolase
MAFRTTRTVPTLLASAALALLLIGTGTVDSTADPTPPSSSSPADLITELDGLAAQTEALAEQYNAQTIAVRAARARAEHSVGVAAAAEVAFEAARREFAVSVAGQYVSGSSPALSRLLTSPNPEDFLENAAVQQQASTLFAADLHRLRAVSRAATAARQRAADQSQQAKDALSRLRLRQAAVEAKTADYETRLALLTSQQRSAYLSRDAATADEIRKAFTEPAPTPGAGRAVAFAIAQVGKPYVWASAGPDSFDCSGLTLAAWAKAGVVLPHHAAAQFRLGTPVPLGRLRPGDLIFLGSDIHHVELYIGNGLAVSAPQTGEDVKIIRVALDDADIAGARRYGS